MTPLETLLAQRDAIISVWFAASLLLAALVPLFRRLPSPVQVAVMVVFIPCVWLLLLA